MDMYLCESLSLMPLSSCLHILFLYGTEMRERERASERASERARDETARDIERQREID